MAKALKKVAMIIAKERFRDEELFDTQKALDAAGVRTTVVSSQMGDRPGKMGGTAHAEMLLKELNADDFDAVAFVGGEGAMEYYENLKAHALAKEMDRQQKVVAAICIAPRILANAGLLKGKKATCYESEAQNIANLGAEFIETDVVRDGRIITGSGPHAAAKFGRTIAEALNEE